MTTPDTPDVVYTPPADPPTRIPLALEDWVSVLILATLALITMTNVVVRYLTDSSFAWTEEISVFLLIVLTMTASATAFVRQQHIRIEIIADNGSATRQHALARMNYTLTAGFFILLAVLSARLVYDDMRWGDTSPAIGVPNWWYSIWMPVLSVVIALRAIGLLRRLSRATRAD